MSAAPLVLQVEGLELELPRTSGAGRFLALRELDLAVRPGEIVALLGSSAAGKSLVGLALLGLAPPGGRLTARRFELDGQAFRLDREASWRGRRGRVVGWVPQEPAASLDPLRRVDAQLFEVLEAHGFDRVPERARGALEEVGLEPEVGRLHPGALSGGMAQRAALALCLCVEPRLIVADEPTTALDLAVKLAVLDALAARAEAGAGVLLVTHDLDAARRYSDRAVVMHQGRVVETGATAQVLDRPAQAATRALVEGRLDEEAADLEAVGAAP